MKQNSTRRRGLWLATAATLAAFALAGCAGLLGSPTLTLSQSELQSLVARHFPVDRGLLDVFDVTVDAPRLTLLPTRNRVAAVVDVQVQDRLLLGHWRGRLSFDAALRWEPRDQTLRLTKVRVQDLALDDPASFNRSTVERLGAALAERVLEDSSLYRLAPERAAKLQQQGLMPGAVNITSRGVEIAFVPLVAGSAKSQR